MKLRKIWDYRCDEKILGLEIGNLINNTNQILACTHSGKILIFTIEGKKLIEEEISYNSPIWNVKINDVDNDGMNEIIIAGYDGLLRVFKHKSLVLKPFWAHQFGASISGLLIHDINNNGIEEIIAYSLDKSIRVLNPVDGTLIWGQLFEDGVGDAVIWTDSTGNNKQIIACSNDGTFRIFENKKGELLWFKRFNDKIRSICTIKSPPNDYIMCGGDDNLIHIIDKVKEEEIKNIKFDEIVWKMLSFPPVTQNKFLVSTYSFDYFNNELPIAETNFRSKLMCIDEKFNISWEIKNINIETLTFEPSLGSSPIIVGTTKGNLILINELTGKIVINKTHDSCINVIKWDQKSNKLFIGHDNGTITTYFLEDT